MHITIRHYATSVLHGLLHGKGMGMNPTPPDTTGMWHGAGVLDEVVRRRWLDALDAFASMQRERGVSERLVLNRQKHLRRFAIFVGIDPWHVAADDFTAWLDSLSELAPTTVASMRGSVRSFYRWGLAAERATIDPTAHMSYASLRKAVPQAWGPHIVAFERHLHARGMLPSTVRSWGEQLRTFARDHATRDPFELTIDDLYEWMASKRWSRETRRNRKSLLRTFYTWAIFTERTTDDPTKQLPKVKAMDPVARPATDDDYAAALSAADDRWRLAIRLAAELGLRRAEVARLHTSDLRQDASGNWLLTVHGKGAKVRVLPVPETLRREFSAVAPGYVFPGQITEKHAHAAAEGHLSPRYMGKRIAELLPPGVTMHALRHRFATRAYNVDRDLLSVQRFLGHSSPATTQRYVSVSDAKMRALVEAVSGR